MLNKIILMIPKSYQNDFSRQRSLQNVTNRTARGVLNASNGLDDMSAKDLFQVLIDWLKSEKIRTITYHSHELQRSSNAPKNNGNLPGSKKVNNVAKKQDSPQNKKKSGLSQKEIEERIKKKHAEFGKCSVCKEDHTFTTSRGTFASSRYHDCPKWKGLPQNRKLDTIINADGCSICTSWMHKSDNCNSTRQECGHMENGTRCTSKHSRYFHNMNHPYVINHLLMDITTPLSACSA